MISSFFGDTEKNSLNPTDLIDKSGSKKSKSFNSSPNNSGYPPIIARNNIQTRPKFTAQLITPNQGDCDFDILDQTYDPQLIEIPLSKQRSSSYNDGYKNYQDKRQQSLEFKSKLRVVTKKYDNTTCYECRQCLNENSRYLTPKCEKHYYCLSCIQKTKKNPNSRYDFCSDCYQYLTQIGIEPTQGQVKCYLCVKFPKGNLIKCKSHQYCQSCFDFIKRNNYSHIVNLSSCRECLDFLEKNNSKLIPESPIKLQKKEITEKDITYVYDSPTVPPYNNENSPSIQSPNPDLPVSALRKKLSDIDINLKCSYCLSEFRVIGFLCNHNYCAYCLNWVCLSEITTFFSQYQSNRNIIDTEFRFKCVVKECGEKISVPCMMIIKNHENFMNQVNYYNYYKAFQNLNMDSIEQWIPYFDGLSSWIYN